MSTSKKNTQPNSFLASELFENLVKDIGSFDFEFYTNQIIKNKDFDAQQAFLTCKEYIKDKEIKDTKGLAPLLAAIKILYLFEDENRDDISLRLHRFIIDVSRSKRSLKSRNHEIKERIRDYSLRILMVIKKSEKDFLAGLINKKRLIPEEELVLFFLNNSFWSEKLNSGLAGNVITKAYFELLEKFISQANKSDSINEESIEKVIDKIEEIAKLNLFDDHHNEEKEIFLAIKNYFHQVGKDESEIFTRLINIFPSLRCLEYSLNQPPKLFDKVGLLEFFNRNKSELYNILNRLTGGTKTRDWFKYEQNFSHFFVLIFDFLKSEKDFKHEDFKKYLNLFDVVPTQTHYWTNRKNIIGILYYRRPEISNHLARYVYELKTHKEKRDHLNALGPVEKSQLLKGIFDLIPEKGEAKIEEFEKLTTEPLKYLYGEDLLIEELENFEGEKRLSFLLKEVEKDYFPAFFEEIEKADREIKIINEFKSNGSDLELHKKIFEFHRLYNAENITNYSQYLIKQEGLEPKDLGEAILIESDKSYFDDFFNELDHDKKNKIINAVKEIGQDEDNRIKAFKFYKEYNYEVFVKEYKKWLNASITKEDSEDLLKITKELGSIEFLIKQVQIGNYDQSHYRNGIAEYLIKERNDQFFDENELNGSEENENGQFLISFLLGYLQEKINDPNPADDVFNSFGKFLLRNVKVLEKLWDKLSDSESASHIINLLLKGGYSNKVLRKRLIEFLESRSGAKELAIDLLINDLNRLFETDKDDLWSQDFDTITAGLSAPHGSYMRHSDLRDNPQDADTSSPEGSSSENKDKTNEENVKEKKREIRRVLEYLFILRVPKGIATIVDLWIKWIYQEDSEFKGDIDFVREKLIHLPVAVRYLSQHFETPNKYFEENEDDIEAKIDNKIQADGEISDELESLEKIAKRPFFRAMETLSRGLLKVRARQRARIVKWLDNFNKSELTDLEAVAKIKSGESMWLEELQTSFSLVRNFMIDEEKKRKANLVRHEIIFVLKEMCEDDYSPSIVEEINKSSWRVDRINDHGDLENIDNHLKGDLSFDDLAYWELDELNKGAEELKKLQNSIKTKKQAEEIKQNIKIYAIPVLSVKLKEMVQDEESELMKPIVDIMIKVGGRASREALVKILTGTERAKNSRQKLLSEYYLEPSKEQSEQASELLDGAVLSAKRTMRLLQALNIATFLMGAGILVGGIGVAVFSEVEGARVAGIFAALGGLAGIIALFIREPLYQIQIAIGDLVQIQTAFTGFVWELNLNGTYIQSRYVADGVLTDKDIEHTLSRIDDSMDKTSHLIEHYTAQTELFRPAYLNQVYPEVIYKDEENLVITLLGQGLKGVDVPRRRVKYQIGINGEPLDLETMAWMDSHVVFELHQEILEEYENNVIYLSLFINDEETNSIPIKFGLQRNLAMQNDANGQGNSWVNSLLSSFGGAVNFRNFFRNNQDRLSPTMFKDIDNILSNTGTNGSSNNSSSNTTNSSGLPPLTQANQDGNTRNIDPESNNNAMDLKKYLQRGKKRYKK